MSNSVYNRPMKISVITVVYNGAETIKDCTESVLSQTHQDVEYIVIDGASTDATMDIVRSFQDKIDVVVSEKDNGMYDAMNKGIARATGDVVAILNADDVYTDAGVLESIAQVFRDNPEVGCVYGDLVMVDTMGRIRRTWRSRACTLGLFSHGWHPPHPAFFVRKDVYSNYGVFDTSFTIAADYEIMLRFLEKFRINAVYVPRVLVHMGSGGASNGSIRAIIRGNVESVRAWTHNGMKAPFLLVPRKLLSKVMQYIVR